MNFIQMTLFPSLQLISVETQEPVCKIFNLTIYRFGVLTEIQIFWHLSSFAFGKKNLVFKKKQVIRELY